MAEMRASVERDHAEMRGLFEQLTPEMMSRPATDGWTVGQLAGHIAVSPRGLIFLLGRLRRGRNVTVPKPLAFIVNVRNWWMVRTFKNPTRDQLTAALDASHAALVEYLAGIREDELDNGGFVLTQGQRTVYEAVLGSVDHSGEHAADLRKGAGLAAVAEVPVP
jgi:hypothetical protein